MPRFVSLIAAACLFAAALGFDTASLRAADSPRLVVTVVVDQLRADYLQVFNKHWRNGFRTLLDQGMVFENARYPYLVTRHVRRSRDDRHRRAAASPRDD